jgi:RNA 2',3'-cyclic 3'-phosphodiesterase
MNIHESGGVTQRLFFALWPDEETRGRMESVQHRFKRYQACWTRPDKLHVTLVFLGNVEAARVPNAVEAAAGLRGSPFHLVLDYAMPIYRSGMLWLTPKQLPDELNSLVKELTTRLQPCGFEPEARRFRPHVTLARKLSGKPNCQEIDPIDWPIDSFALVESKTDNAGSHYIVREVWRLG